MNRENFPSFATRIVILIRVFLLSMIWLPAFVLGARADCPPAEYDTDFTILLVPQSSQITPGQGLPPDVGTMLKPVQGANPKGTSVPAIPHISIFAKQGTDAIMAPHDIWPEWSQKMIDQACGLLSSLTGGKPAPLEVANNLNQRLSNNQLKAPSDLSFDIGSESREGALAKILTGLQQQAGRDSVLPLFVDLVDDKPTSHEVDLNGKTYQILSSTDDVSQKIHDFLVKFINQKVSPEIVIILTEERRPDCAISLPSGTSIRAGDHAEIPVTVTPVGSACSVKLADGTVEWAQLKDSKLILGPPADKSGKYDLSVVLEGGKTPVVTVPLRVTVVPIPAVQPVQTAQPIQTKFTLRFSGSNTLGAQVVPLLAKGYIEHEYANRHPKVSIIDGPKDDEGEVVSRLVTGQLDDGSSISIDVKAHGSATAFKEDLSKGIADVGLSGRKVDIGMASRKIKQKEADLLQSQGLGKVDEFGPFQGKGGEHVIAMDGIAVIVSPLNLIAREISLEDLKRIYSGEIRRWEDVAGANGMTGDITVVRRDYLSGTYDFFCDKVMGMSAKKGPSDPTPEPLSAATKAFSDSNALADYVAGNRQAIGFVGLPYVRDSKPLAIKATRNQKPEEAVTADVSTVKSGKYPLSRPLYLYTANPADGEAHKFLLFAFSDDGQRIIAEEAQSVDIIGSKWELPAAQRPHVDSPSLGNAEVGRPFEFALHATPKADRFQISGPLPAGLTFDASRGIVSGTPTTAGSYSISVAGENSEGWGDASPLVMSIGTAPMRIVLRMQGSNTIGGKLAVELAQQFMRERRVLEPEIKYGPETETPEGKVRDVYVVGDMDHDGQMSAIEIKPHGSALGFVALREGLAEIGLASRKIRPAEYSEVSATSGKSLKDILGDIAYIPERSDTAAENEIGYDGIAVIVNEGNRLGEIDRTTLGKIYSGQINRWEQVPESRLRGAIAVYSKGPNSGTYQFFKEQVFRDAPLTHDARSQYEDGELLARDVSQDRNAIGFCAWPEARGVKILSVRDGDAAAIAPNPESIRSNSYYLRRALYMYLALSPEGGGKITSASLKLAKEFVHMVESKSGQSIVESNGFVPSRIIPPSTPPQDSPGPAQPWKIPFNVLFDTDLHDLDARTKQNINVKLADVFRDNPEYRAWTFKVIGYTDSVGPDQYNMNLSRQRAETVWSYLKDRGYRMGTHEGRGPTEFIGANDTDEGRQKNRRVELILESPQAH
jgi:phosphate transport system substrate-binding protein